MADRLAGAPIHEEKQEATAWQAWFEKLVLYINSLMPYADLPRKNLIINGGFTVNQRVYVSSATLAAGIFGHDRWKAGANGGDYSFTQLESNTEITIAVGKSLIQIVENKNVVGGTYTLSWAGTAQARFGIDSDTPSGAYASSPITVTGQTAGTVMSVEFNEGTLGTEHLEEGSIATPFPCRQYDEELSKCYRFYQPLPVHAIAAMFSSTRIDMPLYLAIPMRTGPSLDGTVTGTIYNRGSIRSAGTWSLNAWRRPSSVCLYNPGTSGITGESWVANITGFLTAEL